MLTSLVWSPNLVMSPQRKKKVQFVLLIYSLEHSQTPSGQPFKSIKNKITFKPFLWITTALKNLGTGSMFGVDNISLPDPLCLGMNLSRVSQEGESRQDGYAPLKVRNMNEKWNLIQCLQKGRKQWNSLR